MRKFLLIILGGLACYAAYLSTLDESKLPPLKDGDIAFQSTWTGEPTLAIGMASLSFYIHVGILKHNPDGWVVIQASNKVEETPLHQWIDQGIWKRFAIYRDKNLTPEQAARMLAAARHYYGRKYDHYFSFDNDEIYCSELVYLAFKDAGLSMGHPQKSGSLHLNNMFTRHLIEQRWHNYPKCKGKDMTFNQCYQAIMDSDIITPYDISVDPQLEKIFSNYPW